MLVLDRYGALRKPAFLLVGDLKQLFGTKYFIVICDGELSIQPLPFVFKNWGRGDKGAGKTGKLPKVNRYRQLD